MEKLVDPCKNCYKISYRLPEPDPLSSKEGVDCRHDATAVCNNKVAYQSKIQGRQDVMSVVLIELGRLVFKHGMESAEVQLLNNVIKTFKGQV